MDICNCIFLDKYKTNRNARNNNIINEPLFSKKDVVYCAILSLICVDSVILKMNTG